MAVAALQRHPSPLRYPGGKGKIANYIKLVMLDNDLVGSDYVEPFAGGASVALSLLFEEYADHVHINDLNPSVFAFWDVVLTDPDALCRRIVKARLTTAEWKRQRLVQDDPDAEPVDLAYSTFFLNRTSRSGIIGAGVIGGQDQSGAWKIDARFPREALIRRVERIARFGSRITVTRCDAAEYISEVLPRIDRPFTYFDPPYYRKSERLYQNTYQHADHEHIAELVHTLTSPWIVSYDAAPEVADMYQGHSRITYDLHYSASSNLNGSEFMFFSRGLRVPSISSPAGVGLNAVDAARMARQ